MNVGSLYAVKEYHWLLFPTREIAADALALADADRAVASLAAYWSKQFNCNVTYFSPDSYIVLLEEDGIYKKVLTSEGLIGWTWIDESYNDCFEEVKPE